MIKSKRKTETKGISYLKDIISNIDLLDEDLKKGDKGESWDGPIIIYSDNIDIKTNRIGQIQTQVKTRTDTKKNRTKKEFFKINKSDMENYFKEDGVLYFYILIKDDNSKRIYYKSLLPLEIKEYLRNTNVKDYKIKFRELEIGNEEKLYTVCRNMIYDAEKQSSFKNYLSINSDNKDLYMKNTNLSFFSFTNKNISLENIVGEDYYLYTKSKVMGVEIPIPVSFVTFSRIECEVKNIHIVNGKKYLYDIKEIFEEGINEEHIGNSLCINNKEHRVNFKLNGSTLEECIKDINFFVDLAISNNQDDTIKLDDRPSIETINKFNNYLQYLLNVKELMDIFNIKDKFDILNVTEQQQSNLNLLLDYYIFKKKINFTEDKNFIFIIELSNIKIAVMMYKMKSDDFHTIVNIFSYEKALDLNFKHVYKENNKEIHKYFKNRFLILNENYLLCDNFNEFNIIKSFENQKIISDDEQYIANDLLLKIIKCYDITLDERYLICAYRCYDVLKNNNKSLYFKINQWQIKVRQNNLDENDYKEIVDFLKNKNYPTDSIIEHCDWALYILLGKMIDAKTSFQKINQENQSYIKKSPLYTLYEQKLNNI